MDGCIMCDAQMKTPYKTPPGETPSIMIFGMSTHLTANTGDSSFQDDPLVWMGSKARQVSKNIAICMRVFLLVGL